MTGRAIGREHRFVPTPETVDAIGYCLAVAGQKYDIALHGYVWMSNHYHLVLTDLGAQLPDFMRDLNSLISKALNAIRETFGQNFDRRSYNAIVVADGARMIRHCAYTEANPCLAHLVKRAKQWRGVSSASLEYGETKQFRRPTRGLWAQASSAGSGHMNKERAMYCGRIKCPELAELKLIRPPCLDGASIKATRAKVRKQVKVFETQAQEERARTNRRVLGMAKVRSVHYKVAPCDQQKRFDSAPKVSSDLPARRIAMEQALEEFISRYRFALAEYRKKGSAAFPEGTWWMKRCLNKRCYGYCPSG